MSAPQLSDALAVAISKVVPESTLTLHRDRLDPGVHHIDEEVRIVGDLVVGPDTESRPRAAFVSSEMLGVLLVELGLKPSEAVELLRRVVDKHPALLGMDDVTSRSIPHEAVIEAAAAEFSMRVDRHLPKMRRRGSVSTSKIEVRPLRAGFRKPHLEPVPALAAAAPAPKKARTARGR